MRLARGGPMQDIRGFLEAGPDAVVITDAAGVIVLANGAAEELFGFGWVELVGRPLDCIVPSAAPEIGTRAAVRGIHRDGTDLALEMTLSALATEDGPFVAATIVDVRDQQAFEARFEGLYSDAREAIRRTSKSRSQ